MGFVMFLVIVILFGFVGLMTWARADLPVIQREIAINTRKDGQGPSYSLVQLLAVLLKISAVLIWLVGLILAIIALAGGGNFLEMWM